jgi:hypothetical protein
LFVGALRKTIDKKEINDYYFMDVWTNNFKCDNSDVVSDKLNVLCYVHDIKILKENNKFHLYFKIKYYEQCLKNNDLIVWGKQ